MMVKQANGNRKKMYEELFKRYIERRTDSGYKILEQIIKEPAPSFYVSEQTMKYIIYKTLRERNKCCS